MFELKDIQIKIGRKQIISELNMAIPKRGICALIGPNGSGKSTLLDAVSGFIPISHGTVFDSTKSKRLCQRDLILLTSRLHQRTVLPADVSVLDYLAMAHNPSSALSLIPRPVTKEKIAEVSPTYDGLYASSGLSPTEQRSLLSLSVGQRRLMAILAVLLSKSQMLLLDEPFAGLGSHAKAALSRTLEYERTKRAIVIAEHDLDSVWAVANQVHVLVGGRLVKQFNPKHENSFGALEFFYG